MSAMPQKWKWQTPGSTVAAYLLSLACPEPPLAGILFVVSPSNGLLECNITSAKFSDSWQTGFADQSY